MNRSCKVFRSRGKIIAVLLRNGGFGEGMEFFTPESSPLQLASVKHPRGKVIEPHVHKTVRRTILETQEIDMLRKGRIRVTLYTEAGRLLASFPMIAGDLILFSSGGHGYEVLDDMEMLLVKQGPYAGSNSLDKTYIIKEKKRGKKR